MIATINRTLAAQIICWYALTRGKLMNNGIWLTGWSFIGILAAVMILAAPICIAGYRAARRARRQEEHLREDLWRAHVPRFVREAGDR